jgi:hypothetical protein
MERTYRTPPLYRLEVADGVHDGALQKFEQAITDALVAGWELQGPPVFGLLPESMERGSRGFLVQGLRRPLEEIHDRQESTGKKGAATRGAR